MRREQIEKTLPPALDSFLAYWASKLVDGKPPVRDDSFSPASLRPWLGHLALISRQADGSLRFRLVGTRLQSRFGAELTGKTFAEISLDILGDLENCVRRAMTLPSPVIKAALSPTKRERFLDLVLPLADADGSINLVVLASYPPTTEQ